MRIHLLSDLHNEFDTYIPSVVDADIVILAGDIDVKARGVEWAKQAFHIPVLYVLGNHEYYRGHMPRTLEKMRSACRATHVQVLERDAVEIGGTRFLGATMWTDFSATSNKPLAAVTAQSLMNDYHQICAGGEFPTHKARRPRCRSVKNTRLAFEQPSRAVFRANGRDNAPRAASALLSGKPACKQSS